MLIVLLRTCVLVMEYGAPVIMSMLQIVGWRKVGRRTITAAFKGTS